MIRNAALTVLLVSGLTLFGQGLFGQEMFAQESDSKDTNIDVRSPVGDLHLGNDVDAKKIGVPLYPGARLKVKGEDQNQANLSMATEAFGFTLLVANYVSEDSPARVLDFYRGRLKKYGKVLECRSEKRGAEVSFHDDEQKSNPNAELKCDQDSGTTTELKVGSEDNQRVVAVEPGDSGKGSTFALVYIRKRGKRGDI